MNILDTIINNLSEKGEDILTNEEIMDMKNKFPFLKLQKPERMKLMKPFLKEEYLQEKINWDFVKTCYSLPERNYQFTAIQYLEHMSDFFIVDDIYHIEDLIKIHPWWDTVNELSKLVGILIFKFPELKEKPIANWIDSSNLWLKVTSILCQIDLGKNTDTDLLSEAIIRNADMDDFFLNKSIGEALSKFSKTNPSWVKNFIRNNVLSNLSTREASRFLK